MFYFPGERALDLNTDGLVDQKPVRRSTNEGKFRVSDKSNVFFHELLSSRLDVCFCGFVFVLNPPVHGHV